MNIHSMNLNNELSELIRVIPVGIIIALLHSLFASRENDFSRFF